MSYDRPIPQYQCHKKVWALEIKAIVTKNHKPMIIPEGDFEPFFVAQAYMDKHQPTAGGYWVQYSDGYQSFSPKEAFEEGYTRI